MISELNRLPMIKKRRCRSRASCWPARGYLARPSTQRARAWNTCPGSCSTHRLNASSRSARCRRLRNPPSKMVSEESSQEAGRAMNSRDEILTRIRKAAASRPLPESRPSIRALSTSIRRSRRHCCGSAAGSFTRQPTETSRRSPPTISGSQGHLFGGAEVTRNRRSSSSESRRARRRRRRRRACLFGVAETGSFVAFEVQSSRRDRLPRSTSSCSSIRRHRREHAQGLPAR